MKHTPQATAPGPDGPAVEVRDLQKTYRGRVEAVKGIDFDVAPGEVFGLLGPNGAGKSTTIVMLTTTISPTVGSARVAGFDVAKDPIAARAASGVVFQDSVVDRALTGHHNLDIHARLWGVPRATATARVREFALTFGLAEILDRPVGTYIAGPSVGASRSCARSCPSRRCSFSTSPLWASTPASGTSCSTSSRSCAAGPA